MKLKTAPAATEHTNETKIKRHGEPSAKRKVQSFGSPAPHFVCFVLFVVLLLPLHLDAADSPDAAGIEFFEKEIRPVLVDHCYGCHSATAEKIKGGLRLDSREALLRGGENGPVLVPGQPDKSRLLTAIRYTDADLQMPPKDKKLSAKQIAAIEHWIRMGAPDPRSEKSTLPATAQAARNHWAFQPVHPPSIPAVRNAGWVQTPVDAFILQKLEANGLHPARPADKRSLIRRASFDLIGLPPTPQEVQEFVRDDSSDAFAKVVDRLLASPQYGERWGRRWLDIARYADTKGYVFEEERRYPYAYTYRDYVIWAFNEDLPYDQFIIQQLAADQLPLNGDKHPLAALGFLTLGRRFLNNQPDIIDDRIDVVSRGLMGLTVGCARCHDHKFDPIPTEDYYSLYGVFASASEPAEKPLLGAPPNTPEYREFLAESRKREKALKDFQETSEAAALHQARVKSGEYLWTAYEASKLDDPSKRETLARQRKLDPNLVRYWMVKLEDWRKQTNAIFTPWFAYVSAPGTNFAPAAARICSGLADGSFGQANPVIAKALASSPPKTLQEAAEQYGKLLADTEQAWVDLLKKSKAETNQPSGLPDRDREQLRQVLYGPDSPIALLSEREMFRLFDVPTGQKIRSLRRQAEELAATHPGAPPRGMVLVDNPSPYAPHIFLRGNPNNPGPEVPRRFLKILSGPNRAPFKIGSGRLELARSIASRDNPLTARVLVNRIWLYHFGEGLVRTVSDFGTRSDPPSHPELLDYLAWRFIDDGWSIKKLHRLIMLSSAYQQTSDGDPACAKVDPSNTLLWRMNRTRLDFEAMRDSLIEVTGRLNPQIGGHAIDITVAPFKLRRSVYGFIDRQNLPGLFRTFDLASPDTSSAKRFNTTVPQQALFMINSPFVIEQARALAKRVDRAHPASDEDQARRFYQLLFQREPQPDELRAGLDYVHAQATIPPHVPEPAVWEYGYGRFDPSARAITIFHPLPFFTGKSWQGGKDLPDGKIGWVSLTAEGGHPGNDLDHVAIRRWTAPQQGVLKISGMVSHETDKGDGIIAHIISNRQGELGSWKIFNRKQLAEIEALPVEQNEVINFVVDQNATVDSDSFKWAPTVSLRLDPKASSGITRTEWNARSDFSGSREKPQPLSPWEKFAQVLLISNEFIFVD